ncbi:MAG TPA: aldo/keto reductase [Burkholderiales bacterium]|nr:aldo/keto reductase [Burkholderiales bacterium]
MKYRLLGCTRLSVSEVGFGGAGIGHVWGATTDAECIRTVRRAVDLGINFFDTSPMYGGGRSEENLGQGLEGLRHSVYIATKVRLQSAEDLADMEGAVRRSMERSLWRLRTDHVDVLQIHHQLGPEGGQYLAAVGPPPRYAYRLTRDTGLELGGAMQRMVEEGKARFLGITAWDGHAEVIDSLLSSGVFHTAQILYNLVNQTAASAPPAGFDGVDQGQSIPIAVRNNIGIIGIRAHAAGALVDELDRDVAPDSEVARDFARSRKLTFLKKGPYATLSQPALRFCLDNPHIATVVPGIKSMAELEETAACTDLPPLDAQEVAELQRLYRGGFKEA